MYCFEAFRCEKEDCPVRRNQVKRCWEFLEEARGKITKDICPYAPCGSCHYRLGWEIGLISDNLFPSEDSRKAGTMLPMVPPDDKPLENPLEHITFDDVEKTGVPSLDVSTTQWGRQGMRFCWEVMECPNPNCPIRERRIIRCFKYFEPRGCEFKKNTTGGERSCENCHYKRGWDLGVINEDFFQDVLDQKKVKFARAERMKRQGIVEIYLRELEKKPLSRDDEMKLAKRIAGDKHAAEIFLLANMKLVVRIAGSYNNRGLNFMDLIQEGNLGLIKAVSKFDWTLGYRFSTYAAYWIRHYLQKAISNQARVVRIPHNLLIVAHKIKRTITEMEHQLQRSPTLAEISQAMMLEEEKILEIIRITETPISIEAKITDEEGDETSTEYFLADKRALSPEEEALEKSKAEACREALNLLPDRLREIVELFYGFREEGVSLAEIGRRMGLSRERARQLLRQALDELQGRELVTNLKDYL